MSDLLRGLRIDQSRFPGNLAWAHNLALDAVREALLNPTDEQVARLAGDIGVVGAAQQMGRGALPEPLARNRREALVRAVLAAAAGGDDE